MASVGVADFVGVVALVAAAGPTAVLAGGMEAAIGNRPLDFGDLICRISAVWHTSIALYSQKFQKPVARNQCQDGPRAVREIGSRWGFTP